MADILTGLRIAFSMALLFCPALSPGFYALYIAVHTAMNKATGALLFVLPLTFPFIDLKYTAFVVCAVATFAAIQEGYMIRTGQAEEDSLRRES